MRAVLDDGQKKKDTESEVPKLDTLNDVFSLAYLLMEQSIEDYRAQLSTDSQKEETEKKEGARNE